MIILTMRTDKPQSEIGLYNSGTRLAYEEWEAHRQLGETIHLKIKQLCKENNFKLSDIKGIVVFKGPGSFTGLRIGISVANALGYGLGVPIVGFMGENWIIEGIERIRALENGLPVVPFYGADANITTPRK